MIKPSNDLWSRIVKTSAIVLAVLVTGSGIAYATTTIDSNIATTGSLTVSGTSTFTGDIYADYGVDATYGSLFLGNYGDGVSIGNSAATGSVYINAATLLMEGDSQTNGQYVLGGNATNTIKIGANSGIHGAQTISIGSSFAGSSLTLKASSDAGATLHGALNYGATANLGGGTQYLFINNFAATSTDGQIIYFKANTTSTGPATLQITGDSPKVLLKGSDQTTQINSGDLITNGIYEVIYDSSLDSGNGAWVVLNK